MSETVEKVRACFFCMNSHNAGLDCDCACHIVAPTFDKLKAINPELDWTIPQLIAVQKLLAGGSVTETP